MMKIAADLTSNSYFPAAAAVELGFFEQEGLDMMLELIFPVNRTLEVLHDGGIDFVGGSAHSDDLHARDYVVGRCTDRAPSKQWERHMLDCVPPPCCGMPA